MLAERARRLTPSPTLALSARARALRAQGIDVLSFTAGEPDFDTPERVKDAAIRALREGKTKYTDAGGIPELKSAICAKLRRDNGLAYESAEVIASVGAKHTLYNICAVLVDPGDEVLVPSPYWVSYTEQVRLCDGVPVVVPTDEARGFQLDLAALRGGGDAPDQAPDPQQPQQPHRRRLSAGRPRARRRSRAGARVLRRLRRVLRRAGLRGARAEHRGAGARDQGADDPRQHVLEGVRDDGLAPRLRGGPAGDRQGDGRSSGAVHVEPDLDRPVGGRRGARRAAGRGREDGRGVRPAAARDRRRPEPHPRLAVPDAARAPSTPSRTSPGCSAAASTASRCGGRRT